MRLKSFHGSSLAEAMRQVREAFGDDAIIVATRDDDAGGVRVTAAIDNSENASPQTAAAEDHDVIELASDALFRHNVHAGLAEKLLATASNFVEDDPVLALAAGFDAHMGFQPLPETPRKPIMLIGQPGSGKTLSIAKLATAAKLKKQNVTVVTTDLVRAGGVEQLAAFTKLLDVKLLEVDEPEALSDIVVELSGQSTVFIDTPGYNPFDPKDRKDFARMAGKIDADIALTMGCGHDTEDGIEVAQLFRDMGARRLILTRADLVRRYGSMVNIAGACGLALANLGRSPQAAIPLEPLTPVTLAQLIFTPFMAAGTRDTPPQTGTHA